MADTQRVHSVVGGAPEAVHPRGTERSGLGVAALVIGIVALVGSLVPIVNYATGVVAIVGLVLGIVALVQKNRRKGVAITGTILSGVALLLSVVLAIVYSLAIANGVVGAVPAVGGAQNPGPDRDAAADEVGSRENPAPLGTTIQIGSTAGMVDWDVTLGAVTLDADDIVADENRFNEPAPEGFQYAMVPVTVVYRGADTGTPWAELSVDFVSAAGTTHAASDSFAVVPSPLTDVNELFPGASGSGNVVVAVPSADVEKGTWVLTTLFGDRYFFSAR